ncbi:MAG: BamA/TamA family outer membrane protein [Candidatus Aminicenantes bacterium]
MKNRWLNLSFLLFFVFFNLGSGYISAGNDENLKETKKSMNVFPILMYDTDIGFGYGGKAKFVNYFKKKESFDFFIFNSTKGERSYAFIFAVPDTEIRQGKAYPFSLDLKAEYSKYLKYYFYGLGADSREEDQTQFTNERKELQVRFGRGFSPRFVVEFFYSFKNVFYFDIDRDKPFTDTLNAVGERFSPFASLVVRYDTSDSQIHPKKGFRLIFQNDVASKLLGNKNASFHRFTLDFRKYTLLFGQNDVLAFRTLIQKVSGEVIPLFEMSSLGGGSEMTAMRGYKLNRFNDKGKFLINAEYRFPLWKRLGGNIFLDGGSVWSSWSSIGLDNVAVDVGWGLRYYLQNFVVRFDMGFSDEGLGIYFNFNHIF